MSTPKVTLHDKTFELSIKEEEITNEVARLAAELKRDYEDKNPVYLVVLSGAFVFASDLLRHVDYPAEVAFTKVKSYCGTESSGSILQELDVTVDVKGRHVVLVEDIVESGRSMGYLLKQMQELGAESTEICALSFKPQRLVVDGVSVKYVGMTLPDAFIVGYGLDYNGAGRLLRDIYSLVD